jgi:D-glycerate 3-kinase
MQAASDPRYKKLIKHWLETLTPKAGPLLIGISGCQGSGKSSLTQYLAHTFELAHFSLDDVYHTKAHRLALARDIHPLFATRGPPLTHDLDLAIKTIEKLSTANMGDRTLLPAFDKLSDDRLPTSFWPNFIGKPRAILVEGWCLGATPLDDLDQVVPVNDLERDEDGDGVWRLAWNNALKHDYQPFFSRFDAILHLTAPSFKIVLDWRCQQEEGLLGLERGALAAAKRAQLARFVAHFERLTRHMLAGGANATATATLDQNRGLIDLLTVSPNT